jgi:hypothetical protein
VLLCVTTYCTDLTERQAGRQASNLSTPLDHAAAAVSAVGVSIIAVTSTANWLALALALRYIGTWYQILLL